MELELTLHIPSKYIYIYRSKHNVIYIHLYATFYLSMLLGHVMSKDALTLMERKIH